jgi:hypothetical protein
MEAARARSITLRTAGNPEHGFRLNTGELGERDDERLSKVSNGEQDVELRPLGTGNPLCDLSRVTSSWRAVTCELIERPAAENASTFDRAPELEPEELVVGPLLRFPESGMCCFGTYIEFLRITERTVG